MMRNINKARVAIGAIKGEMTIVAISSKYGVHPNQISKWRKKALEGLPEMFSNKKDVVKKDAEEIETALYKKIGQLEVELDWLKKIWI